MEIKAAEYFSFLKKGFLLATGILLLISLFSCNTTKKLKKGEYLLTGNKIVYKFGSAQKGKGIPNIAGLNDLTDLGKEGFEKFVIPQRIIPSEILPYVKQKPNTKILFIFPFYLYLYNLPDSVNTARAKARRDSAYVIKAQKKGWKEEKLQKKIARKTGREWIMSQGEAPIILDTSLTQKSTEQIKAFLFNKGYFNAGVKDSIHKRGRKAEVLYIIRPGKPYRIHNINYLFEDPGLAGEIYTDTANCKIRRNDIYDKDILDAESDRITLLLNNAGFYYFSKQFINYSLDTNGQTHLIDITVNIKKFVRRDPVTKDTIESNHSSYHIRKVTVQMAYDPTRVSFYHADDSVFYDKIAIVYPKGQQSIKPGILGPKIFIVPGDIYRANNRDDTYTGLSQLNEFTYISIKYVPVTDSDYVDCYIQLMPRVKHSIGAEFEFTNTGGDGGIQGDLSYGNYNQFNGGEKFQLKFNGGLIAQQVFASRNGSFALNTEDLGPELDLAIPRPWFPFNLARFARKVNPQTSIKLTFNYQLRLNYYSRRILGASYSFDYDPVKTQHFTFALFEWNLVNASLNPVFVTQLDNYNLFFQNSFKTQVITDGRISWIIHTQDASKRQAHFSYWKFDLEGSGLVFYAARHLLNLPLESGIYYISQFNAPFSQYDKLDGEFRHYFILNKKQQIATRLLAGFGLPYDNSSEMPFTKSFWAGGSNDIRAWQIQTLGPGGSPTLTSDVAGQVGETKLEGNVEYRVKLIKYFDIAWFVDAGNIWLLKSVANAGIQRAYMETAGPNPFWSEIAVGTGPGFRFDFDYFVFRVDLGFPLKDPSLPAEHRWLSLNESARRIVLNIGIGFPF